MINMDEEDLIGYDLIKRFLFDLNQIRFDLIECSLKKIFNWI